MVARARGGDSTVGVEGAEGVGVALSDLLQAPETLAHIMIR
jgi:hypothetical protein